jgi:hypothetical protein
MEAIQESIPVQALGFAGASVRAGGVDWPRVKRPGCDDGKELRMEPANLCRDCRCAPECFLDGVAGAQVCSRHEPMSIDELLEKDRILRHVLIGVCPACGSSDVYDCENTPLFEDVTVGHCLHCDTYWCLVCGHVFEAAEKGNLCPHWAVCRQCSEEHGFYNEDHLLLQVWPACDQKDDGCRFEDPSQSKKRHHLLCPHLGDVSGCPTIRERLERRRR